MAVGTQCRTSRLWWVLGTTVDIVDSKGNPDILCRCQRMTKRQAKAHQKHTGKNPKRHVRDNLDIKKNHCNWFQNIEWIRLYVPLVGNRRELREDYTFTLSGGDWPISFPKHWLLKGIINHLSCLFINNLVTLSWQGQTLLLRKTPTERNDRIGKWPFCSPQWWIDSSKDHQRTLSLLGYGSWESPIDYLLTLREKLILQRRDQVAPPWANRWNLMSAIMGCRIKERVLPMKCSCQKHSVWVQSSH